MKKIGIIKDEYQKIGQLGDRAQIPAYRDFIDMYSPDDRKGVQSLIVSAGRQITKLETEIARTAKLWEFEHEYQQYGTICGIDEVGRGPLAGPVVAAAVILPMDADLLYINDSKQLSAAKREELFDIIMDSAVSVGIGVVSHERIDEINILQATYEAMRMAVSQLDLVPDVFLNDAVTIPGLTGRQVPIIKGDAKSISIGAASIIAKVYRDRMMAELDAVYPGYDFASNKGYGSPKHIEGLKRQGPCAIHRRSFIGNLI